MPIIFSSEAPVLVVVSDEFEGGTVLVGQTGSVSVKHDSESLWLSLDEARALARSLTESLSLWEQERSHYTIRYSSNPQEEPNG